MTNKFINNLYDYALNNGAIGGKLMGAGGGGFLIETSNHTHEKIKNILLKLDYILLIYEYYIIKDKFIDYRSLGDLTKLNQNQVISNDRFEKKFYSINKIQNNFQLLTNSFAIPKSKQNLITLKITELN